MTLPFTSAPVYPNVGNRRSFLGGSDARIIMGSDEVALVRLWQEKRGEAGPPDYSDNLVVQLGLATEPLNRRWFEKRTGQVIKGRPKLGPPPSYPLDGCHAGWDGRGHWSGVRGKIHAPVVLLGRGGRREAHGAGAAQHVGHQCQGSGALDHYRGRQMG